MGRHIHEQLTFSAASVILILTLHFSQVVESATSGTADDSSALSAPQSSSDPYAPSHEVLGPHLLRTLLQSSSSSTSYSSSSTTTTTTTSTGSDGTPSTTTTSTCTGDGCPGNTGGGSSSAGTSATGPTAGGVVFPPPPSYESSDVEWSKFWMYFPLVSVFILVLTIYPMGGMNLFYYACSPTKPYNLNLLSSTSRESIYAPLINITKKLLGWVDPEALDRAYLQSDSGLNQVSVEDVDETDLKTYAVSLRTLMSGAIWKDEAESKSWAPKPLIESSGLISAGRLWQGVQGYFNAFSYQKPEKHPKSMEFSEWIMSPRAVVDVLSIVLNIFTSCCSCCCRNRVVPNTNKHHVTESPEEPDVLQEDVPVQKINYDKPTALSHVDKNTMTEGGKSMKDVRCDGLFQYKEEIQKPCHVFISHPWAMDARLKAKAILVQMNFPASMDILKTYCLVLAGMVAVVDLAFGAQTVVATDHQKNLIIFLQMGLGFISYVAAFIVLLHGHSFLGSATNKPVIFQDQMCVHQGDAWHDKPNGTGKHQTKLLRNTVRDATSFWMLWSPEYLSRIWCILEVAEFTKVKGVKNIQFMPVGLNNMVFNMCKFFLIPVNMVIMFASLIIVMQMSMANTKTMSTAERDKFTDSILSACIPIYLALGCVLVILRGYLNFAVEQIVEDLETTLSNYKVGNAQATVGSDKALVRRFIVQQYGSITNFNIFVRNSLRPRLIAKVKNIKVEFTFHILIMALLVMASSIYGGTMINFIGGKIADCNELGVRYEGQDCADLYGSLKYPSPPPEYYSPYH